MNIQFSYIKKLILVVSIFGMSSGCTNLSTKTLYDPKVPNKYGGAPEETSNIPHKWWLIYNDDVLNGLVETTLKDNPNLGIVYSRLTAASALVRVAKSDSHLHLDAATGVGYSRTSETTALGNALGRQSIRGHQYSINTSASWEFDLWKRVANAVEAANAKVVMAKIDVDSYVLILSAEVVAYYWQVRAAEADLAIFMAMRAKHEETVKLLNARLDRGFINELDLSRAQSELANSTVDIEDAKKRRVLAVHGLATLTGNAISEFSVPMASAQSLPPPPAVTPGLPADILARRPDLAESTQSIRASLAQRGIAKAAFYPSIRLTSNYGFASKELDETLQNNSREFAIGPLAISLPIFDGKKNRSNFVVAEARYQEAIATHKSRLLIALREVDDALTEIKSNEEQVRALEQSLTSAKRTALITQTRYQKGVNSFLEVTDADRNVLLTEHRLINHREKTLLASVQLIRALGGGWNAGEGWTPP